MTIFTKCLYCPTRIATSRRKVGNQTVGIAIGCRGNCKNCQSVLYWMIRNGKLTEAEAVSKGWMLPDTGEGRRRQTAWNSRGLSRAAQPPP